MTYLLFPGRHHLLTKFQSEFLTNVLAQNLASLLDVDGRRLGITEPIDTIVWAITSANHENTMRNPLPANRREVAIEEFCLELKVRSLVYSIDDLGRNDHFAEYVLKKIEVESRGQVRLSPENAVLGCSTPEVIEMYERLGFRTLPFELADRATQSFAAETPWELMRAIFSGDSADAWRENPLFLTKVAAATQRLYLKYDFGDTIVDLFRHPFLTEDGDLTETRDYNTYVRSFDNGAERKYALIQDFVKPGRIVDIGCCTGSLLQQIARDERYRESDLYGIEVARHLFQECLHRKQQGAFANDNVFFYQRNAAAGAIFTPNSINTFATFALTHELESYQGRAVLEQFMSLLHSQLALGGRWINVDVVGPENKDDIVYQLLNRDDGRNDDYAAQFSNQDRGSRPFCETGVA
jgi:nicotinamide mononucleotide adenylyltransferase